MHPILTSRSRLGFYLGFWFMVAVLLAAAYASASAADWLEAAVIAVPLVVLYGLICLSAWYVCQSAPLSVAGLGRVLMSQLLASAVTTGIWMLFWEAWTQAFQGYFEQGVAHYRSQLPLIAASGALLYWSAAMFHYLLIAFENSRAAIARGLELEIMAREAELKALRAQIDPHFLFNALNSISALTATDPNGARDMCIRLAEFFRSSVRLGKERQVPLAEELEMVRNYLDIERIRCGNRLTTRIDVGEECHDCQVPPLILQPLIENAVLYGIHSRTEPGSVTLDVSCASQMLVIAIENPFDERPARRAGTGVGLINVKRRLRALFDRRAGLDTSSEDGVFRVELRLPCVDPTAETGT